MTKVAFRPGGQDQRRLARLVWVDEHQHGGIARRSIHAPADPRRRVRAGGQDLGIERHRTRRQHIRQPLEPLAGDVEAHQSAAEERTGSRKARLRNGGSVASRVRAAIPRSHPSLAGRAGASPRRVRGHRPRLSPGLRLELDQPITEAQAAQRLGLVVRPRTSSPPSSAATSIAVQSTCAVKSCRPTKR
jgi:hypothetical protein